MISIIISAGLCRWITGQLAGQEGLLLKTQDGRESDTDQLPLGRDPMQPGDQDHPKGGRRSFQDQTHEENGGFQYHCQAGAGDQLQPTGGAAQEK